MAVLNSIVTSVAYLGAMLFVSLVAVGFVLVVVVVTLCACPAVLWRVVTRHHPLPHTHRHVPLTRRYPDHH